MINGKSRHPEIIITFADGECSFVSVFWGDNERLMQKARDAIRDGDTEEAVKANLRNAGFFVIEEKIR